MIIDVALCAEPHNSRLEKDLRPARYTREARLLSLRVELNRFAVALVV
jgi:hypothetical protein